MKLVGFKKSSERTYYFGRYPHLYVEVVENPSPLSKELCETEIVKAADGSPPKWRSFYAHWGVPHSSSTPHGRGITVQCPPSAGGSAWLIVC